MLRSPFRTSRFRMPLSRTSSWLERARRRLLARIRRDPDLERLAKQGMRVGRNVYVGRDTYLSTVCPWLITIGDDTVIGSAVTILCHDNSMKLQTGYTRVARVDIGRRVYIGGKSIILPGVTVGDDAIIGAGSIVCRPVPPAVVVAGNPAGIVQTTAEFAARHGARLAAGPRWDEPIRAGDVNPALAQEMRAALEDHRVGYIR
jgi:maltose O-acetyltransferase